MSPSDTLSPATLAGDLEAVRCQIDCRDLVYAFADHIDHGRFAALADLFTAQGVIDGRDGVTTGQAAILQLLSQRPANRFTRHLVTNVRITQTEPSRAEGTSYVLFFRTEGLASEAPLPIPEVEAVAEWIDRFEQTAAGWRIAHRKIAFILRRGP